jgi:outer membrane protein assembly factor BamB
MYTVPPPPEAPVILLQSPYLRALDRATGKLIWEAVVGGSAGSDTGPGRLFPMEDALWVVSGAKVFEVDPTTGKIRSTFALPFAPDTAIFDGQCFFVCDLANVCAVDRGGKIRWKATVEHGLLSDTLVCRDSTGRSLWKKDHVPTQTSTAAAGIAIGHLVSQPDAKGHS